MDQSKNYVSEMVKRLIDFRFFPFEQSLRFARANVLFVTISPLSLTICP